MYNYEQEKKIIFTETGQHLFLRIRDRVNKLLSESGAFIMAKAISEESGSTWTMLACVDFLEELGEIKELTNKNVMAQNRVFISNKYQ